MNLIILILTVLTVLALTDFFFSKNQRLHNQTYYVALFVTFFLFTIKYCYGADIALYVPYYNELPTIRDLPHLKRPDTLFEPGFNIFCFLLKSLGVSFWGMTAIISAIYFYTINKLLKIIPAYRTFALCLIVCFDYNLIFATFRQCLAVSFYILMYFAYTERKTISMFFYLILTCTMHKSGLFFGLPTYVILLSKDVDVKQTSYYILVSVMLLSLLLQLKSIALGIANIFSFNEALHYSIEYHFSFTRKAQAVLPIYVIFFVSLALMKNKSPFFYKMNFLIFLYMILIATTYQFFPLLWRIRSYFIPFLITYIFTTTYKANNTQNENIEVSPFMTKNRKVLIPISSTFLLLFCVHTIISSYKVQNGLRSGVYETCTVFDLLGHTREELESRQVSKAIYYWRHEALEK